VTTIDAMVVDHSNPLPSNGDTLVLTMDELGSVVDACAAAASDDDFGMASHLERKAQELALSMIFWGQGDPKEIARLALQTSLFSFQRIA